MLIKLFLSTIIQVPFTKKKNAKTSCCSVDEGAKRKKPSTGAPSQLGENKKKIRETFGSL